MIGCCSFMVPAQGKPLNDQCHRDVTTAQCHGVYYYTSMNVASQYLLQDMEVMPQSHPGCWKSFAAYAQASNLLLQNFTNHDSQNK